MCVCDAPTAKLSPFPACWLIACPAIQPEFFIAGERIVAGRSGSNVLFLFSQSKSSNVHGEKKTLNAIGSLNIGVCLQHQTGK